MVSIRLSGLVAEFREKLTLELGVLRGLLGVGLGGGGSGGGFSLVGPRPELFFLPPAEFLVDPKLFRLEERAGR
jgi:hypothetical protein